MYSFNERPDTICFDEPLYASFLRLHTHLYRPYREELLEKEESDSSKVLLSLMKASTSDKPIVFVKNMAKHSIGIDKRLLFDPTDEVDVRHVFLLRDPLDMIISWGNKEHVHQEGFTLDSSGLPHMVSLFSEIRSLTGVDPIVFDSTILKAHPKAILYELCTKLDIPFYDEQLSWKAGKKTVDGCWAAYWYDQVHRSTGYKKGLEVTSYPAISEEQLAIYREMIPFYNILRRHAIGVDRLNPGCTQPPIHLSSYNCYDSSIKIIDHGMKMKLGSFSCKVIEGERVTSGCPLNDKRNEDILIWVGSELLPREHAKVSVFDSIVQGGDGVWEGLRVYRGKIFKLHEHLKRLQDSAKALAYENVPSNDYIISAIYKTLTINGMLDGVHVRLTLSRGPKVSSSMNPYFNIHGTNLLIVPEWKPVGDAATYDNEKGICLITATNRRNGPQFLDSKIHHCNMLNNILPKIQANYANAADALMLDAEGFVSETNATNVFIMSKGICYSPHADYCLPGITRETVFKIVKELGIEMIEKRVSLAEFYSSDECFSTGTMGELTPVTTIDGRIIGKGLPFDICNKIREKYRLLTENEGVEISLVNRN
jgi:branched-subunit amino acid aminotransferase/4-amino-4-deoxychorismate lyase